MRKRACKKFFSATGSNWAVGSSNNSKRGCIASTAASVTICFCPPERASVPRLIHGSIPKKCATSATRRRIASGGVPKFSKPNASSCHTVSHTIWFSGLCATYPTAAAEPLSRHISKGWSSTLKHPQRLPTGAVSGLRERKRVVLPLPVPPTKSAKDPVSTHQERLLNTGSRSG